MLAVKTIYFNDKKTMFIVRIHRYEHVLYHKNKNNKI